ncbi:LysE/ArgO family amino acid transporter [Aureimonas jatrophae]|uniref:L-lysine exporter family protein LysE/ArgO n=1 Tax=Aureimonas jatrophae TaxID=1166073 RepID=A0A1H0CXN3_9HYPH|nr:LysE/ArgO family amino acid transporter [Aureimonas jatrophae]MBB3949401.1 L-lysine exporter family protein LysE/ArgO [Aureimonas jatrophae]SDN62628.1 L-lysine exporter family protein LysE/ArgO [Aureimonas jatrophae]
MLDPLLRGFLSGGALIVAIGAQNAFVLERGLARSHVLAVCLICALSDAVLIAAGVGGLGSLIVSRPALIAWVTIGGALFLFSYAALASKRALRPAALLLRGGRDMALGSVVTTCLALTFLNPHVYLDTVVLLGSLSARYGATDGRLLFALGAMAASFTWFFALGYGARLLAPLFAKPAAWRVLDAVIAVVMAALGLSLLLSLRS